MFEIILSPEAAAFFAAADAPLARKLSRCFRQLESDPLHHNNIKRLSGTLKGKSRFRIGEWRVIFRVDAANLKGYVLTIAHRRDVYE